METLHYQADIRDAEPMFSGIEDEAPDEELLEVATQLIDKKTAPFDASVFEDHYAKALHELINRKRKSKNTPRAKASDDDDRPEGENVVDLMGALKQSLKDSKGSKTSKGGKSGGGRKKAS